MSRRRSHAPRARKSRNTESEAPRAELAVAASPPDRVSELVRITEAPPSELHDELAAVDAAWDDL